MNKRVTLPAFTALALASFVASAGIARAEPPSVPLPGGGEITAGPTATGASASAQTPSPAGTHGARVGLGDDGYVPLVDVEERSEPNGAPRGLVQPRDTGNRLLVRPSLGGGTDRPSSVTAGACAYVSPYECRGAGVVDQPLPGRGVRTIAVLNVLPIDPAHPSVAACTADLVLVESPVLQIEDVGRC
jgi:hypothetical protein